MADVVGFPADLPMRLHTLSLTGQVSNSIIPQFAVDMTHQSPLSSQCSISNLPVPTRSKSLRSRRSEHPTVTLELHELDRYHDRAERALSETIAAYGKLDGPSVDTSRWKCLRAQRGVCLFRGRRSTSEGQIPLLCVGTLRGRFDDILEGLYCDNTESMLLMNSIKCPRLAESAVLYAVQKKTIVEPYAFTGIKWATVKLSITSNRDLCYFDKMGLVRQRSGKRTAYHVMQSVDLPQCTTKTTHKRLQISVCYVLEELEDDLVGVYMQGQIDQVALSYFATPAVSEVLLAITNGLECTRAKKLALIVSANQSEPRRRNSSRKNCYVCKGSSSFFESLSNCAGCSKHVCKKCRSREHVLARDKSSSSYLTRAEFCGVCISKVALSSLEQIRVEATGCKVAELCDIDEEIENVKVDIQGSDRSLTSFVHKISAQLQELSTRGDSIYRASNLSSMGRGYEDDELEHEDRDVLNSSRLKSDQFVVVRKGLIDMSGRSPCSTSSTTSSHGHDYEDPEQRHSALIAKLQKVASQAEETWVITREHSLIAHSVRARMQTTWRGGEWTAIVHNDNAARNEWVVPCDYPRHNRIRQPLLMPLRNRQNEHPTVHLELPQLDRYHDRAERALSETITAYGKLDGPDVDASRWKSLRGRHGIRLFRARQLIRDGQTPLLCVGTLRGQFDDILEGMYCSNTEEMLLMNAISCPKVVDSAVLYAVETNTMQDPYAFTGLKWVTIKPPVGSNRDLCFFDKMGMVRQNSGKRMAYHVMQSVDLAECPQRAKHKRVYASLSYVFEELEDDLVGVFMQGDMNYTAQSLLAVVALSEVLLGATKALECTRAKKLALMISHSRPADSTSRKSCYVCHTKTTVFEKFAKCVSCNQYVCKKCRFKERVLARNSAGSHLKCARFCSVCLSKMNLSSLNQIRYEGHEGRGLDISDLSTPAPSAPLVDSSNRSLTSFVRNIATQVQEQISSANDTRASNLSFLGQMSDDESVEILDESEDELYASRLKPGQFNDALQTSPRSLCSTTSTLVSVFDQLTNQPLYPTDSTSLPTSQLASLLIVPACTPHFSSTSAMARGKRPKLDPSGGAKPKEFTRDTATYEFRQRVLKYFATHSIKETLARCTLGSNLQRMRRNERASTTGGK
ncbi:unnamed protein product [Phytophthora fragariaefolia]|uniref:Unnamed protein product n=1 Tax=Phytophthora fragariaefolia TaxID=1490495 RepID=A0A9W6WM15_9STRA|nr:unnamed protein product [Phytophthora fragariaefolia]